MITRPREVQSCWKAWAQGSYGTRMDTVSDSGIKGYAAHYASHSAQDHAISTQQPPTTGNSWQGNRSRKAQEACVICVIMWRRLPVSLHNSNCVWLFKHRANHQVNKAALPSCNTVSHSAAAAGGTPHRVVVATTLPLSSYLSCASAMSCTYACDGTCSAQPCSPTH